MTKDNNLEQMGFIKIEVMQIEFSSKNITLSFAELIISLR